MHNINVSVIVPIYDYSVYLPTCLNSIVNQDLDNIEIILVNNARNNIKELIEAYNNKFNNIKIIHDELKNNFVDLNLAINESKGKYIAFIDSNDFIEQNMLKKLFHVCENNDLDIGMCKSYSLDDSTQDFGGDLQNSLYTSTDFKNKIIEGRDVLKLTTQIYSKPYNKLFNRSFLINNNISYPCFHFGDEVFFYNALLKADKISIVDEYLYVRRFNNRFSENDNYLDNYAGLINSNIPNDFKTVFSVVIPCFNVEEYVGEAVESVVNQTLDFESSVEIILVDDGSTDGTFDICSEFVERYPSNVRLLRQENGGQASARNLGLKYASGKYVSFLDADDKLTEDTLSNAYNFFEQHFDEISFLDYPISFFGDNYSEFNENDKLFSVVIPCFNVEEYVGEAVGSVVNQTLDFESSVEIILVDDGSTDGTFDICSEFVERYPSNVRLLRQENGGQASARNLGLKYASGKYVSFLDADDKLTEDTFLKAYEFFEKHYDDIDLVAFPMYFFGRKTGDHILNYKFKKDLVVKLDDCWNFPQLSASSAIFKRTLFDKFQFDTNLISSEDSVMVNKILLEKMAYGVISTGGYCYRKRFEESSTIDSSINDKNYYNPRLKGYFCELIDYSKDKLGYVPKFIQYLIVYDIKWIFLDGDSSILNSNEIVEFNRYLRYIFANIEDEVISCHFEKDPYKIKLLMFKLKYDKFIIKNNNGKISLNANNQEFDVLNKHNVYIDIIEIKNDTLFISGLFKYYYYDKKDFDIFLTKNSDEKYYPEYVTYSNRKESTMFESKVCFDFEVSLDVNKPSKVEINIVYRISDEEVIIKLPIKFLNHARMSEVCNYSIWGDYFIKLKDNAFLISKYSFVKFLKEEIAMLIKILKFKGPYWTSALCFHLVYLILFLFYKNKKIWLVMDRQDRADDNAEHLFNYMVDIKDTKNKYFVISKDAADFSRLSSIWKNVLGFYSIKHRILYLFADKIISSQADEIIVNPFWGKNIKWYSGLLTGDKIFLQHGVAKDDMSTWLRKYDKNVKLLVTTSDLEAKSFDDYNYHYAEGVVQVLGLPRYDNLSNESSNKQILIMPSWRRSLIHADENQIQKSEYFLRFNSLINNEKFIRLSKSLGYKIIFKPHPNTFEFIDLFDRNDYVIIDDKSKYQDLFNNSSLLITDYSSLAFDFAYIKKPIIYYQYGNDYHFDNNFFVYQSMGFGEVIKDEDELIDTIEEYLNNDCKIKDKYLKRSNSFYKFNDKNNCKRVYNAIKKIK